MVNTMIGMVRDDVPFNQVLSSDFLYKVATPAELAAARAKETAADPQDKEASQKKTGEATEQASISLKDVLIQHKQAEELPDDDNLRNGISGILTSRAFGASFYSAGTNRRATAFVLKNFLCHEIEQLHDTSTPKDWVRQDVDRSPSGDPKIFNERCVGCHAGMDALSGWSVNYDYRRGRVEYGEVQNKIFKNNLLTTIDAQGQERLTPNKDEGRNYSLSKNKNEQFANLWTEGKNASLGWRGKKSGKGAKEFGQMIARSKAFTSCMASHVYQAVCYLNPEENDSAKAKRDELAIQFEEDDYNMRHLFAMTAVACLTKHTGEQNAGSSE